MKVLVADDDRFTRELLRHTLARDGYEVLTATDGEEAIGMLRDHGCRLLISDWEMPRVSGPELCRRLRSAELPWYVYTLMLTARTGTANTIEALTAGADDFVTKPLDPAELLVRVRNGARIISLQTSELALFALAKLAESRDDETGAHLERVREYSRILAAALAADDRYRPVVTPEYIRMIYVTSPLHDIGKVGIPDAVLLKPARLNDREFEIMKSHTLIGARTLDALLAQSPGAEFLVMSRDIALTHHEQWDGGGYPNGLKGEAIPLCGRIVALADVYDALTSRRVYKPAFPHDVAGQMIAADAGRHFDPHLTEVFLACEEQLLAVRARYLEAPPAAAAAA